MLFKTLTSTRKPLRVFRRHATTSALVFVAISFGVAAQAQQALPAIDVGAARSRATGVPRSRPAVDVEASSGVPTVGTLQPPNAKLQLDIPSATGSRLGLTPRQTPGSITIIDRATIEARGAETTKEAVERAPGVVVGSPPGSAGSIALRGFTTNQITQLYNGVSIDYTGAARPIDSWLTERVEALGGASSYLYGQGAVGGVINYVSKVANREQSGHQVEALGGSWFNRRLSYGYNGRLGNTDNWLQVAASYRGSNGWIERTPFSSGVGSISLLSDITSQLSHTLAVEFHAEERDAYFGAPLLNPIIGGKITPWSTVAWPTDARIDPGTRFKNYNSRFPVFDQQAVWARDILDYRLSDAAKLRNMFYYHHVDRQWIDVETYRWNATNTLVDRSASLAIRHVQELIGNRLEATRDDFVFDMPMKTVAGVDVSWNRFGHWRSREDIGATVSSVNPYSFVVGKYEDNPLATSFAGNYGVKLRTVALFAENRLSLTPQLHLVTGLRWEDIEFSRINFRPPTPPSASNPFGDPAFFRRSYQPFTWRAALMCDITKDMNVYVSYSTAADLPSSSVFFSNAATIRNFNLTTGSQIEAGAKADFLDGRGSATIAGYFIERKNLTTRDPNDPSNVLPVGAQSSNGVEANVGMQLTPEISLQGNAAWVNAKFDKFDEAVAGRNISRAGNRPNNIARWVANGWLTWAFLPDWRWQFVARFVGDRFANDANTIKAPAYTTFDTALSWQIRPETTLTARVRNLTDAIYAEWLSGGPMYIIGQPRTFEMALSTKF